jgi:hypothetical protein
LFLLCIFFAVNVISLLCIQETRHIVAAITQQITYNEFLPMVLGKEVMSQHDLILLKDGYFDGYDRYTREKGVQNCEAGR